MSGRGSGVGQQVHKDGAFPRLVFYKNVTETFFLFSTVLAFLSAKAILFRIFRIIKSVTFF